MRRIYKSMIWVSVLALSAGAVSAQKAERKNVREGNKLMRARNTPSLRSLIARAWR